MNIAVKAVTIMLFTMLLHGSGVAQAQVQRIGGLVSAKKMLRIFTVLNVALCLHWLNFRLIPC